MRQRWLYVILILSLGLNFGIFLKVGYHLINKPWLGNKPFREYQWHKSLLSRKLNLTEEQTKTIQDYQKEMEFDSMAIRDRLGKKRQELMTLIKAGSLTEETLDAHLKEISSLQGQMEKKVILHLIKIHKALAPKQITELNSCFEQGFCFSNINSSPCYDYMKKW